MSIAAGATAGHRAVSVLYQALLTGCVLALITRRGETMAAELVFRLFRRQHLEKFLPGLAKLGLDRLPHAVACAQYHYLSNRLGGVKTEYVHESDAKAWVRYPPPRWIWAGASICAIPSRVNAAMLEGWHGHNGVSLGNPRLGFVCTGQTVDGQPGLEGYYLEHDHDLAPYDPAIWRPARLDKVVRSYAMEYVRTLMPVLQDLVGPDEMRRVLGHAARLIGMQFYDETSALLGVPAGGATGFADYLGRLARAQGETVDVDASGGVAVVRQTGWRLGAGLAPLHPAAFEAWSELWQGALSVHDRRLRLEIARSSRAGQDMIEWRIGEKGTHDAG